MTKKDYIKIAYILRINKNLFNNHNDAWFMMMQFANMLQQDNKAFDINKFISRYENAI